MAIKSILFDADGVVINSEMFSSKYQKEFGISPEEFLDFFNGEFNDCIVGKADLTELIKPWLSKWKWKGTVEEFLKFWFEAENNLDDGMIDMIKKLREKGIKCYLATNQEKHRTKYLKDNMGFEELFDKVFSSADIGYRKPEKEFYELVLNEIKKEYNISPHEIMFFDDSKENIDSAKKLNINANLYKNFKDFEKLINSIFDL